MDTNYVEFWNNLMKLPREKIAILNDESVSLAEKIALFDSNTSQFQWKSPPNDISALLCGIIGELSYGNQDYERAIGTYNEGLCFSSSQKARGILYAFRSEAFLALRLYQDCLDSIRLAKECPLPANKMRELLARESIAITNNLQIEVASGNNTVPTEVLSYRRNKRIPTFAYCLNLKVTGNPYAGIVTTENLLPGDVLVVEAPLIMNSRLKSVCDYCFREGGSLQLCICGRILFCSPKCKEQAFEAYHKYECSIIESLDMFSKPDCLVLRVFFKLIQRFKDVTSLRAYLDSIKTPNPFDDDFEACSDPGSFESQFRLYYATEQPSLINCFAHKDQLFRTNYSNKIMVAAMAKTAVVIKLLKVCKKVQQFGKNEEDWSFLSEVLFRLILCKSFTVISVRVCKGVKFSGSTINGISMAFDYQNVHYGLHGSALRFRTSCRGNENVNFLYDENNMLTVRARKYIPRGTELLAPYYISVANAPALKALFPSSTFDLSKACFCAACREWFSATSAEFHQL